MANKNMPPYPYNGSNMDEWPSLWSGCLDSGCRLPLEFLSEDGAPPPWSDQPPLVEGFYWIFDFESGSIAPLHLYRSDPDEPEECLHINIYEIAGNNPTCDQMAGNVLYGPPVARPANCPL